MIFTLRVLPISLSAVWRSRGAHWVTDRGMLEGPAPLGAAGDETLLAWGTEVTAAAGSILLMWVMKRRRRRIAGLSKQMILSTYRHNTPSSQRPSHSLLCIYNRTGDKWSASHLTFIVNNIIIHSIIFSRVFLHDLENCCHLCCSKVRGRDI